MRKSMNASGMVVRSRAGSEQKRRSPNTPRTLSKSRLRARVNAGECGTDTVGRLLRLPARSVRLPASTRNLLRRADRCIARNRALLAAARALIERVRAL
jgi:hypothetical protein